MKKKIKVAIDSGPLKGGHSIRGIGAHTRLLIQHLQDSNTVKLSTTDLNSSDLFKYDVIHYPSFHPFFLSFPLNVPRNSVLTIHDLIPLIYPKAYPPGVRGKLKYYLQKLLVNKFTAIITISETSKKDIVRFLNIPAEKIHVIYLAPRKIFKRLETINWKKRIQKKYNLPGKFVLYVGDVNYNKNIYRLAQACQKLGTTLIIIGKQASSTDFDKAHSENQPLVKLLKKYGESKLILRLGFVQDNDLVKIYNLAAVYVQPSLYEGFGLPVLEAMACGTPTACSRTQALVEIAADNTIYFDPNNINEITGTIQRILENKKLALTLSKKGIDHAKKYSWKDTAKKTAEVYFAVQNTPRLCTQR